MILEREEVVVGELWGQGERERKMNVHVREKHQLVASHMLPDQDQTQNLHVP